MGVSSIDRYGTCYLTIRASVDLAAQLSYATVSLTTVRAKVLHALILRFSMAQATFGVAPDL